MRLICLLSLIPFLSTCFSQQQLTLLSNWKNIDLPASSLHNNTYNEVWGFVQDGREYAIIGSTMGTHIFDITNGGPLVELHYIPGTSNGDHIVHRDYHDYKGYLYAVSDEDNAFDWGSLQIIDLTLLPDTFNIVYESHDLFRKSHNIFIDSTAAKMYACSAKGGQTGYQGLKVFDLTNPIDPVELNQFKEIGEVEFNHVHDAFAKDNIVFLNCGFDGLIIADFTNDEEPELITHYSINDYPKGGYNHSGWANEDLTHYYFADENHGSSIKILETNEYYNSEIKGSFFSGNETQSIPHNQVVNSNYLFISYYYDGVQIYDIEDPENPTLAAFFNTSILPYDVKYEGAWGVYPFFPSGKIIVSDMQNGLFLFDCFDPYCQTVSNTPINDDAFVNVFPNPSNGFINIESSKSITDVKVFTLQNQSVWQSSFLNKKSIRINTSSFVSGMYIVICNFVDGTTATNKVVVQY